jgi:hypothetical protein
VLQRTLTCHLEHSDLSSRTFQPVISNECERSQKPARRSLVASLCRDDIFGGTCATPSREPYPVISKALTCHIEHSNLSSRTFQPVISSECERSQKPVRRSLVASLCRDDILGGTCATPSQESYSVISKALTCHLEHPNLSSRTNVRDLRNRQGDPSSLRSVGMTFLKAPVRGHIEKLTLSFLKH